MAPLDAGGNGEEESVQGREDGRDPPGGRPDAGGGSGQEAGVSEQTIYNGRQHFGTLDGGGSRRKGRENTRTGACTDATDPASNTVRPPLIASFAST